MLTGRRGIAGLVAVTLFLTSAGSAAGEVPRIFTVAGTGAPFSAGDGGRATAAGFAARDIGVLPDGSFLIADELRVRRVGLDGIITTVAGTGRYGFSGDGGPAVKAAIEGSELATQADGSFLIADYARVRRVGPDGIITTVAGTGKVGFSGDGGPATQASLDDSDDQASVDVSALPDGGFLIAGKARIRRVDPNGIITTVAGTGTPGFSGDGGPATSAAMGNEFEMGNLKVAASPDGGFLIADYRRVRRVGPDGIITTVAGTGEPEIDFGPALQLDDAVGPATKARIEPRQVAVLPDGGFLIADYGRVRRVGPDGVITTVAGNAKAFEFGYADGGSSFPSLARFSRDGGPALDAGFASWDDWEGAGPLAALQGDGFLVAEEARVRLVARSSAPLLGLALGNAEGDRVAGMSYRTRLSLSRPATIRLELSRRGAAPASTELRTDRSGWAAARLRGRSGSGLYTVRATASTAEGNATSQTRRVILGRRLADRWAIQLAGGDHRTRVAWAPSGALRAHAADTDIDYEATSCHRFGPRRVDCEIESAEYGAVGPDPSDYSCDHVAALHLGRNGQVYQRDYGCPGARRPGTFKARPQWSSKGWRMLDLGRVR
jgi:hypothetical protein